MRTLDVDVYLSSDRHRRLRGAQLPQGRRTFKDDAGLPMRVIADSLGQADILTTQRHYLARGKAHPEAAAVLDRMLEHPADYWRLFRDLG